MFDDALVWASGLHRAQARKGTTVPYAAHLLAVASLVLEDGGTEDEAVAALLHDSVEDCGKEVEPLIRRKFGDVVADIVLACSDDTPPAGGDKRPWAERKQQYIDHLASEGTSASALKVSAADKLHNARATLTDLCESGLWPAANACRHQSLWFYQAIASLISERLPRSRTARELAQVVDELYATAGVPKPNQISAMVPACPAEPPCAPPVSPAPALVAS